MNGYSFQDVFGAAQEGELGVDFICSSMCDGEQTFDSLECNGPYACGVQACAMDVTEDSRLTARACPLVILEHDNVNVQTAKQEEQCVDCTKCGHPVVGRVHGYPDDWGRGCAEECSRVLCDVGEIYDWTDARPGKLHRCKQCNELTDDRLCATADHQKMALATTDVSGNRPRLQFVGCAGKNHKATVEYGQCVPCTQTVACDTDRYFAACPYGDASVVCSDAACPKCVARDGQKLAKSSKFTDEHGDEQTAYCQVSAPPARAASGAAPPPRPCRRR